jgi:hypothetical protein
MPAETRPAHLALDRAATFLTQEITAIMEAVSDTAEAVLRTRHRMRGKRSSLTELERTVREHLEHPHSRIWGLGFVADPTAYPEYGGLEWWQRSGPGGSIERLIVSLDPASVEYYDYTRAAWFAKARDHGTNITGPYIDATGTNEHIVTFTQAVLDEGRFIGVAGADVLVATLQSALQPLLLPIPGTASLVDREGKVIATNDPRLLAGVVSAPRRGDLTREVPPTPWLFVVRRPRHRTRSPDPARSGHRSAAATGTEAERMR